MSTTGEQDIAMSDLIEAHARHLRASGHPEKTTIRGRVQIIRRLHDDLPYGLCYASTEELTDWLGANEHWSQWTRATYAMHIRGFYSWADGRYLDGDPSAEMAKPKVPDCVPNPVTEEELAYALTHSPDPWQTAILLAAFAGLRASECARLRRENVTEDTIRIEVAKGGSPASVETHPLIWEQVNGRPRGPLLRKPNGDPVTGAWLSARQRDHFNKLGQPDVHLHRFRHRYGTALLDGGANLEVVRQALRHKRITSTQGYTLVRNGQRRMAIRSLPAPTQPPEEN